MNEDDTYDIFEKNEKKRKKTSHSHGRKLGINVLSDVSSLPFQVIVFRAGWMVKNLHSAFDYIFNSTQKDDSCAHVLAGWLEKNENCYEGGFSPSFDAIKTEPERALHFLQVLFLHQSDFMDSKVLKMLFASILRFYNDFEAILSLEPKNKFEGKYFSIIFV